MKIVHSSMNMDIKTPIIQSIQHPDVERCNIQLDVLRTDLVHPVISGNKFYKLYYNIEAAKSMQAVQILTFGGAYSNHLHATAAYCQQLNMPCIGIVRGAELHAAANHTLHSCADMGMQLIFISRKEYLLQEHAPIVQHIIQQNPTYIIPAGGHNALGAKGIEIMINHIEPKYDYIIVSVGSGTTIAGLANYLYQKDICTHLIGMVPMKGGAGMRAEIDRLMVHPYSYKLIDDYHFGGFGKYNDQLLAYMEYCQSAYDLPLDYVYNAKMFYGIQDLISNGTIPSHARVLAIHTGGLQGVQLG